MTADSTDVFVIDSPADLPTFCAFACKDDDPAVVSWIDFWAVEPCDRDETDYLRGQRYADEAIFHVQATGQRIFIECVLIYMAIKLRADHRHPCSLEHGFIDRIARHFPGAIDKAVARARLCRPGTLN